MSEEGEDVMVDQSRDGGAVLSDDDLGVQMFAEVNAAQVGCRMVGFGVVPFDDHPSAHVVRVGIRSHLKLVMMMDNSLFEKKKRHKKY